jgi:hypothetical protein
MPNWCSNSLTVSGDATLIADFIATMIKKNSDGNEEIDFNGVLPLPVELSGIVHGFTKINGKEYRNWREIDGISVGIEEDEARDLYLKYGATDWYDWCCDKWGTKWNGGELHSYSVHPSGTEVSLGFDTAWSPPEGVYDAMAECWPELNFGGQSTEEGMGFEAEFFSHNGTMYSIYRDVVSDDNWDAEEE